MRNKQPSSERGQVLIIVAGSIIVIIAMVGLVIDGGFAWGQQRQTQNGTDAISEAGAVQLADNLAGVSPQRTDADVLAAVTAAADADGIPTPTACYTNFNGHPIDATGSITSNPSSCSGAALVGGGLIPSGSWGVRAEGSRTFNTFLMRVIGIRQMTTTATATTRVGYTAGACAATAGCNVLPITVPVTVVSCDSTGNAEPTNINYTLGKVYIIPLCKVGPGNVGWIDWTPTAGGTNELIQAILTPSNPALSWPGWYYMTSTGNVNSLGVESALRTYDGQKVQFPNFDATCNTQPSSDPSTGLYGCPDDNVGGNGSNQWYHIGAMATFVFCSDANQDCVNAGADYGAYINGTNKVPCDTGNGATSCIAGYFVKQDTGPNEVTQAPPPGCDSTDPNYDPTQCLSSVSVQLIH
jgi:Putative Flp pilus-assembly TadE/G-like